MRAFAKLLRIENSALSKILRGRRRLTRPMLLNLASRLGLGPSEIASFERYLIENDSRSGVDPVGPPIHYEQLTLDAFTVISDWYHYAILELTRLKDFRPDAKWVANVLDISPVEVTAAVERLVRLGLMKAEEGKWTVVANHTTINNHFTDAAFRKFQRQVLEKAVVALEQIPLEARDQTNVTMAIDTRRLPEAREMIKNFRRKLSQFLESSEALDQVYQVSISLYPLTQIKATTTATLEGEQK
jgi:transcriptional regulator with XRE-family HTH domain